MVSAKTKRYGGQDGRRQHRDHDSGRGHPAPAVHPHRLLELAAEATEGGRQGQVGVRGGGQGVDKHDPGGAEKDVVDGGGCTSRTGRGRPWAPSGTASPRPSTRWARGAAPTSSPATRAGRRCWCACDNQATPPPMTRSRAHTTVLTQSELNSAHERLGAWKAWLRLERVNQEVPWPNSRGMNVCSRKAPDGHGHQESQDGPHEPRGRRNGGLCLQPGKQGRGATGRRPALSGAWSPASSVPRGARDQPHRGWSLSLGRAVGRDRERRGQCRRPEPGATFQVPRLFNDVVGEPGVDGVLAGAPGVGVDGLGVDGGQRPGVRAAGLRPAGRASRASRRWGPRTA